jgi:hypothetical protein
MSLITVFKGIDRVGADGGDSAPWRVRRGNGRLFHAVEGDGVVGMWYAGTSFPITKEQANSDGKPILWTVGAIALGGRG